MQLQLKEINDQTKRYTFTEKDEWVREILTEADEELEDEVAPKRTTPRKASIQVQARKVNQMYVLDGEIETEVYLVCSRCTKRFSHPTRSKYSLLLSQEPNDLSHNEQGKDIDISYIEDDTYNLKDMLSEQIQLNLPFQPLCSNSCKGMCFNCGADLNHGRCACKKDESFHPFAKLKNLDLPVVEAKNKKPSPR